MAGLDNPVANRHKERIGLFYLNNFYSSITKWTVFTFQDPCGGIHSSGRASFCLLRVDSCSLAVIGLSAVTRSEQDVAYVTAGQYRIYHVEELTFRSAAFKDVTLKQKP
ncbi:unnamed protein product [Timema podura]|uniref:Uncharacterized protein n=1 Tax=Timema podura TaxID=61482 RepID=A0ABN7P255_TIMPD|nr:unnamed protein product [Timema podura]